MVSNGPNGRDPRRASRTTGGDGPRTPGTGGSGEGQHVSVSIPSDFAASRELQHRIIQEVTRCGYNEQNVFAIKLALEEAMINAIKHGNKLDMKKQVHVDYLVRPDRVEVIIEDEGPGFDRSAVPDPTLEENICKCSGRGILLMEAYMNTVEFSKGGRRIRMVKQNEPDAVPRKS